VTAAAAGIAEATAGARLQSPAVSRPDEPPPDAPLAAGGWSSRRRGWALVALLVWATVLRLWLATYALGGRGFDEQYNIKNVVSILETGSLRPHNAFYGGLSYLPHAGVAAALEALARATGEPRLAMVRDGRITAAGHFACRVVQVLFGLWSLLLAERLGRRLFGPAVGLLGAFLLAATTLHVNYSAYFKPDIQLLAFMLLAFGWTLDAARRPSLASYAVAGAGVGLAAACKFNGAMIAMPLVLATVLWSARKARVWAAAALAAAVAVAIFALFNPFLRTTIGHMSYLYRGYYERGIEESEGHLLTLVRPFQFLVAEGFHGPLVALLALGGFAGLVAAAARRRPAGPDRRERALFLAWPLLYIGAYAALTTFAKRANFLPILPFTALAAAYAGVALGREGAARAPARAAALARGALLVVAVAFVGWLAHGASRWVYEIVVPSTAQEVGRYLSARIEPPHAGRILVVEDAVGRLGAGGGTRDRASLVVVPALSEIADPRLDLADAEVFPAARLEGAGSRRYDFRLARRGVAASRFAPRLLRAWGAELIAIVHPWTPDGEPRPLAFTRREGAFCAPLPAGAGSPAASLDLLLLDGPRPAETPELRVGDAASPLQWVRQEWRGARLVSERFRLGAAAPEACLVVAPDEVGAPAGIEATLTLWRPAPPPR
jgi:4-amino-4-deoxy-L-arabinose transferase-like glycosyltransferase